MHCSEVNFVISECVKLEVTAVVSEGFAQGGNGTVNLAKAVVDTIENGVNDFKKLYDIVVNGFLFNFKEIVMDSANNKKYLRSYATATS